MSKPALIGLDWGTTNCRAFLLDHAGNVLNKASAPKGILQVADGAFGAAFDALVGGWRADAPDTPVLLAGMIGSRNGWVEAPYVDCPADPAGLSKALTPVSLPGTGTGWIVPGVAGRSDTGVHDVMRGEETQIAGAIALSGSHPGSQLFCLPGTHSKWVAVIDRRIAAFRTAMTGEVFGVLTEHSILGRLMEQRDAGESDDAFIDGVSRARDDGGLLHHLFGVRAEALFDAISPAALPDYLSGILIGHEIAGIGWGESGPVTLIGSDALVGLYEKALDHLGRPVSTVKDEDAAVAGLWSVAVGAGLAGGMG